MSKKNLSLTVLFLLLMGCLNTNSLLAQRAKYFPGQLLVQTLENGDIDAIVADFQTFNGKKTALKIDKFISPPMRIWLVNFDHKKIDQSKLLDAMFHHAQVSIVQNNHITEKRETTPDDPQFDDQWQYVNDGSSGGTVDGDIDADQAWDITTGGTTVLGDRIVVAIVDDGIDVDHPDMVDNLWTNQSEIPNNGVDDDGNGYVDDYLGWNAYDENDDISGGGFGGGHGTPVAGIVGAVGNNQVGVAGVNWDVELMIIPGGGSEAAAIAAYTYPYVMRNLYNNTGGGRGAFVVATNSSWGNDFGQPEDAPLWCAFYDTLGTVGILSAGATINGNQNVDEVGDLPTACPSDYLISVTNMNRQDVKVNQAGYGATTIDLGAHGQDTWTVASGGGYGGFGGTSGATPHVAGAIALLYSVPCVQLAQQTIENPAGTALLIRQYIMDGVDQNASLQGITKTGGRLNLFNSATLVSVLDCAGTGCYAPFATTQSAIEDSSATVSWEGIEEGQSYDLRYRVVGVDEWTTVSTLDTSLLITTLMPCTQYEYQLASICDTTDSNFSLSNTFTTANCCLAPADFELLGKDETSATFGWSFTNANTYDVEYRAVGETDWSVIEDYSLNFIELPDLQPCTQYEVRSISTCDVNVNNEYTQTVTFKTFGCGSCLDIEYCENSGESSNNGWITNVSISDLDNNSGNDGGFGDYTNLSANLVAGSTYELNLSFGNNTNPNARWRIWIDYDQNGTFFNQNEILYDSEEAVGNNTTVNVTIPPTAEVGGARMRVALRKVFPNNPQAPQACESFGSGEIEDYCVDIQSGTGCYTTPIEANVGDEEVTLNWTPLEGDESYTLEYQTTDATEWTVETVMGNSYTLTDLLPCINYEARYKTLCAEGIESDYSVIAAFKTKGCGVCVDTEYCEAGSADASEEWIAGIFIGEWNNLTGSNSGYGNFTEDAEVPSVILGINETYDITLSPGFGQQTYEEQFRLWIDLNQDGEFGDEEILYESGVTMIEIMDNITIPSDALLGSTRMRVGMRYVGQGEPVPEACEVYEYGEVEDYCVEITAFDPCQVLVDLEVADYQENTLDVNWADSGCDSYTIRFRREGNNEWTVLTTVDTEFTFTDLLPSSEYEFQVRCEDCDYGESIFLNTAVLGIETTDNDLTVSLSPNPFKEQLMIQVQANNLTSESDYQFQLIDATGRVVRSLVGTNAAQAQNLSINTANLPSGIYFLQMQDATKVLMSQKVVKF
ncbi:MAG: GEVED domain-containing protein [Chitinophagales bacterium]